MMAAIFFISAQPGDQLHLPEFLDFDKAWHMLEYGILAALWIYALRHDSIRHHLSAALGVIIFVTLYGIGDEFHQSFVPLRTPSGADVLADFLGATVVTGIWWQRSRRNPGVRRS